MCKKRFPLLGGHEDIDPSQERRDVFRGGIFAHAERSDQLQDNLIALRFRQAGHDLNQTFPCLQLVRDAGGKLQQVQQVTGILVDLQQIHFLQHLFLQDLKIYKLIDP